MPVPILKVCVIVVSAGSNGDWTEKYWHEMAHCNGWEHGPKSNMFGQSFKAPEKYKYVFTGEIVTINSKGDVIPFKVQSVSAAKKACKYLVGSAAFGCFRLEK